MSGSRRHAVEDDEDGEVVAIEGHDEIFAQLEDGRSVSPSDAENDTRKRSQRHRRHDDTIKYPDREVRFARIPNGETLKIGDSVELRSSKFSKSKGLQSGDFLRVQQIIYNDVTQEVRLRGLRLQRTKYHEQIFSWKLNELVMVLNVHEDDQRSELVQCMEDVEMTQVLRKREVLFSPRPYVAGLGLDTFRDVYNTEGYPAHWGAMTLEEQRLDAFHNARLVCRNVHVRRHDKKGKFVEGEIHLLYRKESDCSTANAAPSEGNSRNVPINLDDEPTRPMKRAQYTSADAFCCGGGASQGAVQAGFKVTWGLDKDNEALQTYALNHPGAVILMMDAHDFSLIEGQEIEDFDSGRKTTMKVDLLHLSPPCCYWSPAKTTAGPNDQANYESFTAIGPIIKKVAPRVFTMEQTSGLYERKKFRRYFNLVLNDMFEAGYNVRYKIQDCSKLGVPQPRMRLLIIGARRGIPLPPFPKDTHGPPSSGLKPFVFVGDALRLLERQRPHAPYDPYDDVARKKRTNGIAYDPKTNFLKGCITTGGGGNHHYSGLRKYTARELAALQTFPSTYQWLGSPTTAIEMIGNAVPPKVEEQLALSCAQVLEAFDEKLIDAEDDISDLRSLLASRGCVIQRSRQNPSFGSQGASSNGSRQPLYRYLSRLADNDPEPPAAPPQRKRRRTAYVEDEDEDNGDGASSNYSTSFQQLTRRESRPYSMAQGRHGLERRPTSSKDPIDLT